MTLFHKSPPPWLDKVKDLPLGGSRRISDAHKVTYNGKGYFLWDFREKAGEVYEPELSLAEKLAVIKASQEVAQLVMNLATPPLPAQKHPQDWPVEARLWLYKAGFNNEDIQALGAYWNPRLRRVVIPYRTLDGWRGWIARKIMHDDPLPKYLFPNGAKRGGGAYIRKNSAYNRADGGARRLVITEDYLSAWRVAEATGYDAVAAQGTSLDREAIVAIAAKRYSVAVWLDPDVWGQQGAKQIRTKLGALDVPTINVLSGLDPKYYADEDIKRILTEGYA